MEKRKICINKKFYNYKLLIFVTFFVVCFIRSSSGLSFDFYAVSCPSAEIMVKNTVRSASSMDPTTPGKLLRLFFHDCFVEGCDASILLQGNDTERSDPANKSLGAFSVIDSAKRVLEIFCPGVVSCADILALAARDAVELTGGPNIQIPTGRRDGRVSLAANVRPNIIDTSFTLNQMANIFSSKGLSMDDLVTLSGAHTIGSAHCSSFSDRFKLDSNGKFNLIDASLDREYAAELTRMCPAGASASITVNNDRTNSLFDYNNIYPLNTVTSYKEILHGKILTPNLVQEAISNQDNITKSSIHNQKIVLEEQTQQPILLGAPSVMKTSSSIMGFNSIQTMGCFLGQLKQYYNDNIKYVINHHIAWNDVK
ncbi:peroxidase 46-like [Olea europaea var. sylvestris]|uniref:peroxidase 46-like n=1 Tax=Olea europaea var. sylvestris TaxID=158386 RepID=UPI000C1CEF1A|nr:peroxidase 46-like [Olea europaea var. sylvestris]